MAVRYSVSSQTFASTSVLNNYYYFSYFSRNSGMSVSKRSTKRTSLKILTASQTTALYELYSDTSANEDNSFQNHVR
jgi:hypothetical protein